MRKPSRVAKSFAVKSVIQGVLWAGLGLSGMLVQAQEQSPWLVRARVINLDMLNQSTPVGGVGASDRITVNDKVIPELDISYFLTKHIAAELVLTYPQKQDVKLDGNSIGSFKHLPPTLSLQYHFAPDATVRPYVGVGVNYTRISNVNLANGLQLEKDSLGLAYGAGADIQLNQQWFLNFDVKKVQIRSDVLSNGAKISEVKLDPWLVGVGIGMRF